MRSALASPSSICQGSASSLQRSTYSRSKADANWVRDWMTAPRVQPPKISPSTRSSTTCGGLGIQYLERPRDEPRMRRIVPRYQFSLSAGVSVEQVRDEDRRELSRRRVGSELRQRRGYNVQMLDDRRPQR